MTDEPRRRLTDEERKARKRERSRAWNEANAGRVRETTRAWKEANPGRVRIAGRLAKHRRRALKAGSASKGFPRQTIATRALIYKLFNAQCAYCGAPATTDDHVIALSQGGADTPLNIVPACESCNFSKGAKPVEAWYLNKSFFDTTRWAAIIDHTKRKSHVINQVSFFDDDNT